jgi:hypothetical protein
LTPCGAKELISTSPDELFLWNRRSGRHQQHARASVSKKIGLVVIGVVPLLGTNPDHPGNPGSKCWSLRGVKKGRRTERRPFLDPRKEL